MKVQVAGNLASCLIMGTKVSKNASVQIFATLIITK